MIRGLFVENGLPTCWKSVPHTLKELMDLLGDNLYLRHIFKDRIVIISNKNRTKFFVCKYRVGGFDSLPAEDLGYVV